MDKTAFILDDVCVTPDRQIGRHSQHQWELTLLICGSGNRTIGDLTEPMSEGEIILIPPNIPHVWHFDYSYTDCNGNIANLAIFFDTAMLDKLAIVIPEFVSTTSKIKSLTKAVNIKGKAYNKIYELMMSMRGMTAPKRIPKMIELLQTLAEADNYETAGRNNTHTLTRAEQMAEKVRIFCSCNYARKISLGEIAAHVGQNKSSFCTFMRRHTGMSLSEYVNDIRLRKAMEMLCHTDNSISDIAYDTGFANVTYFNRLFRQKYGCKPKSVRNNPDDVNGAKRLPNFDC